MTKKELVSRINDLLEESKCAVLASVTKDNVPRIRWMTPTFFPGEDNLLYAVTSPDFNKIHDMESNENVSWMFQSRDLRQVVTLRGKINIIDNPSIKSEIIERIGGRLHVFWKLNEDTHIIVLETVIEEGIYFNPMKPAKEIVEF